MQVWVCGLHFPANQHCEDFWPYLFTLKLTVHLVFPKSYFTTFRYSICAHLTSYVHIIKAVDVIQIQGMSPFVVSPRLVIMFLFVLCLLK